MITSQKLHGVIYGSHHIDMIKYLSLPRIVVVAQGAAAGVCEYIVPQIPPRFDWLPALQLAWSVRGGLRNNG